MSDLERTLRSIETKASQGRAVALSLTSDTTIQELHQEDMLLCIGSLWSTFEDIEQLMGEVYGPLSQLQRAADATHGQDVRQDPTTTAADDDSTATAAAGLTPEKVQVILSEIANEAVILESLLLHVLQDTDSSSSYAALTLVQKIGYLADLGSQGGSTISSKGGAEAWFLPPTYHAKGPDSHVQEIQQ